MNLVGDNKMSLLNTNKQLDLVVDENQNSSLFLNDLYENNQLNITLKNDSKLKLSLIADKKINELKIIVNLEKNANFDVFFADFSNEICILNVVINLNGEGSEANWHLASLADKNDNKNINVSIIHNAPNTFGKVDNYGVCKNEAKLLFAGVSHIVNGAIKSKTQQNAKIMVFDEHSDAIAKPILKIDENDIEANHAAVVGKISDEHLFYLTSRGISLDEARTLITLGYLKPIFKGFNDEQINYLNSLIGGRL